jgi:ribose transport system permease protein
VTSNQDPVPPVTGPTASAAATADASHAPAKGRGRGVSVPEVAALVVVLVALFVFFSITSQYFLNPENLVNILQNVAVVGIIACPATLIMIAGQFDLSVGSAVGFVSMLAAVAALAPGAGGTEVPWSGDLPLFGALAVAMAGAILIGVVNAFFVTGVGINALITTLGTLAIFRGLTKVLGNGQTIRIDGFGWLGVNRIFGIPIPVYIFIAAIVIFWFILKYTVYGRSMFAIGASPTAARLAGIRTKRLIAIGFVITSACAGLAGLIRLSQVGGASVNGGLGIELSVVTAVVLGGTSLAGGKGGILGTVLAVLIIGVLGNGLIQLNVPSFWIEVAGGALLLGAVSVDRLRVRVTHSDV